MDDREYGDAVAKRYEMLDRTEESIKRTIKENSMQRRNPGLEDLPSDPSEEIPSYGIEINRKPEFKSKRFYEIHELRDLNAVLNKRDPIKIFVCNFCHQWNKVHESQLKTLDDMTKRPKLKKVIHMEVDEEVFIGWNKLKANFGTHERALAIAMSEFYKHNH